LLLFRIIIKKEGIMKSIIKNSLLLLATLMICLSEGYTQSGWFSQASGTTNHLFGVWFTDANTGTVVGGLPSGCILRTTDAGTTWTPQSTGLEDLRYLGAVCFSDSINGWAVGDTVLHTTNAGNTWSTQVTGGNAQLEAVYCIDSNMVWAVGDSGTILHTTNGGVTWDSQTSGTKNLLWGVFFTDADTGTIVGNGGTILRTTNGGATWTSQTSGTTTTLGGVYFTDANTGTIVGSIGTILRTTNGGATWTSQNSGSINQLWSVFFINADTGTVVGGPWPDGSAGGIILHTTNGGITWTKQNIPTQRAIYRVFFTDANTGTAVGYNGIILRTLTGGEPLILNQEFNVDENCDDSTLLCSMITDSKFPRENISFYITDGDPDHIFELDTVTGDLILINSGVLDYETSTSYSLMVEAQFKDSIRIITGKALITIYVNNINDNAPVVNDTTFNIDENCDTGSVVGAVIASDADGDLNPLTFSIISGNDNNTFTINNISGIITVDSNDSLDYETQVTYALIVQVSDNTFRDSALITINVNDVDETSVGNINSNNLIKIYPNPASDILYIDVPEELKDGFEVEMFSVTGRVIFHKSGYIKKIDISDFQKGIYFVTVKSKEFITTERIIKIK
jgi:photosystem II stability/assembly factor-like uncharacterized protein